MKSEIKDKFGNTLRIGSSVAINIGVEDDDYIRGTISRFYKQFSVYTDNGIKKPIMVAEIILDDRKMIHRNVDQLIKLHKMDVV